MLAYDTDLQPLDRLAEFGHIVGHRLIEAGRVVLIEARHDAKQARGILGGSRDDAGLV